MNTQQFSVDTIRNYFRSTCATIYDMNDAILMARDEIANVSPITDVLDNQNYNTLRLARVLASIDETLEVQMEKRNGADYHFIDRGKIAEGEMKACRIKGSLKSSGGWQFHSYAVLSNGNEDYFLLYLHADGIPQRVYDVRDPAKVSAINTEITKLASEWKAKVDAGTNNGKHDAITLKESFVRALFAGSPVYEWDGDLRRTARPDIMTNQTHGTASIYSDFLA